MRTRKPAGQTTPSASPDPVSPASGHWSLRDVQFSAGLAGWILGELGVDVDPRAKAAVDAASAWSAGGAVPSAAVLAEALDAAREADVETRSGPSVRSFPAMAVPLAYECALRVAIFASLLASGAPEATIDETARVLVDSSTHALAYLGGDVAKHAERVLKFLAGPLGAQEGA